MVSPCGELEVFLRERLEPGVNMELNDRPKPRGGRRVGRDAEGSSEFEGASLAGEQACPEGKAMAERQVAAKLQQRTHPGRLQAFRDAEAKRNTGLVCGVPQR